MTIISDIHQDINRDHEFDSLYDEEFVVVAGDISGSPIEVTNWVTKNIKNGVFIEGNHLGYSESGIYELDYKEGANNYLSYTFDGSNGVKFLENSTYEKDGILFVGATLYTDFNLYGTPTNSMQLARNGMNDYRYVNCMNDGKVVPVYPDRYLEWHKESVAYIDKVCELNKDKKIVVVSHHGPSEKSIHGSYANNLLNPAYVSNLEWLMEKHDNLKVWAHGHIHENSRYEMHGTRVICNPYGYYNQMNRDMTDFSNSWYTFGYRIDMDEL